MPARPMHFRAPNCRLFTSTLGLAVLATALVVLTGCQHAPAVSVNWRGGPFFEATNLSGVEILPAEFRRVALLPLAGVQQLPTESAEPLREALLAALLRTARFELVTVDSAVLRALAGKPMVGSTEVLPAGLFDRIRQEYAPDAVLFVEVTHHQPYAPLALGVRAKLVLASDPKAIIWAFDTLYDAANPAVANSARRHLAGGSREAVDPGPTALQSPRRFAAYVCDDLCLRLPQRPAPLAPTSSTKVSETRADEEGRGPSHQKAPSP